MAEEAQAPQQQPANTEPEAHEGGEQEGGEGQPSEHQQRIARQYANLRKEKKAWQQERSAWEKEREAGRGELGRLAEMRQKAPNNIGAWLQAGGISPQQLNAFLTQNTQRANDPYEQRISETSRKLSEELEATKAQIQEMKNEQMRSQNIDKISRIVDAKPDDFELIRHYGAQADVAEFMDLYLAQHGEKVTEAEACSRIERYLEDSNEESVRRALAARKIAKRIGWQQPGESDDDAESQPGDDDEAPASEKPTAQHRSKPTRGKPKLTNASPSSGKRKPEVHISADPYDKDSDWERFKAIKMKRP